MRLMRPMHRYAKAGASVGPTVGIGADAVISTGGTLVRITKRRRHPN